MAGEAIRIVPMQAIGLENAAAVMARAFFDEPLFVAGFPSAEERERVMPWIAQWTVRFGLAFGTVLISQDFSGTAIAYQATESEHVFSADRVSATEDELRDQLGTSAWTRYERMMHLWETADEHLSRSVSGPYWYLDMIAVEPSRQGSGIGGALLQAIHGLADADGWPSVLLTFRARNVPFYERHGYEVVATGTEPTADLDYWGLRRAQR